MLYLNIKTCIHINISSYIFFACQSWHNRPFETQPKTTRAKRRTVKGAKGVPSPFHLAPHLHLIGWCTVVSTGCRVMCNRCRSLVLWAPAITHLNGCPRIPLAPPLSPRTDTCTPGHPAGQGISDFVRFRRCCLYASLKGIAKWIEWMDLMCWLQIWTRYSALLLRIQEEY